MNQFDDVRLDIVRLLREQAANYPSRDPAARSADSLTLMDRLLNLVKKLVIDFLLKTGLWSRLIKDNLTI